MLNRSANANYGSKNADNASAVQRDSNHSRKLVLRLLALLLGCLLVAVLATPTSFAQEEYIVRLSNGMILGPGILSETDTLSTSSFQRGGGDGAKSIAKLDDHLRYTYFNKAPINANWDPSNAAVPEQIELPSVREVARAGNSVSIKRMLGVSEFNKYGRRELQFLSIKGVVRVLQGITVLTPKWAKLEILNTDNANFAWETRKATNSIPAPKLRAILQQALGMEDSGDWLRLVRFYTQAERFQEAREIMEEALRKFPSELADRRPLAERLNELYAKDKFEEIKLRRDSGQHLMAARFLGAFPVNVLPIEAQVTLKNEIDSANQRLTQMSEIAEALKSHVELLPSPDQQVVNPLVQEILGEISHNTLPRMADFQRLRNDPSIPNENKVALALSGWMLGIGSGMDNFAVVKSLLRVRGLVNEYLGGQAGVPRRQQIVQQLRSEEGAQPALLDLMLETMKPPQLPPVPNPDDPPGLFRDTAPGPESTRVEYIVQVPPEYDPNRKYPCLFAIPGFGNPPELQVNFWCGEHQKLAFTEARSGFATRNGYIVVSPNWMVTGQSEYQYTEVEKARLLSCLRSAFRKFSIDTDRVFAVGHFAGATAAWDLAGSHPDLWAGAVMISPVADKYIVHYDENLKGKSNDTAPLGTYVVFGELDDARLNSKVGTAVSKYLQSSRFDAMVTEYRGRGREMFIDEVPRIFEWMDLSSHRRTRAPKNIETKTMRGGDRFFYWLEAPELLPKTAGNPFSQFDPADAGTFEAALFDSSVNGVNISKIPSPQKRATVWLTPQMVDFSRPVIVSISARRRPYDVTPDIGIMLEDVRTRGDRMHVFWQKIDVD